jgi:hypothetical protein
MTTTAIPLRLSWNELLTILSRIYVRASWIIPNQWLKDYTLSNLAPKAAVALPDLLKAPRLALATANID